MPFAIAFPITARIWILTKTIPLGASQPLQGVAVASAVDTNNVTHYLVVDQHGGIPPNWVAETDVVRAEVRRETA